MLFAPPLLLLLSVMLTYAIFILIRILIALYVNCHVTTVGQDIMIVKQEEQIEALSGILAQQMLEPNYKVCNNACM
jgi:hypothetical protein